MLLKNFISLFLMIITLNSCATTNYPSSRSVSSNNNSVSNATNNFEALMAKDKIGKVQRNGEVVNQLINEQPGDKVAAITVENNTDCNIIVKISGAKNYLLPIYKNDKNFLIIDKGNYIFSSKFCRAKYYSQKRISESVTIALFER